MGDIYPGFFNQQLKLRFRDQMVKFFFYWLKTQGKICGFLQSCCEGILAWDQ